MFSTATAKKNADPKLFHDTLVWTRLLAASITRYALSLLVGRMPCLPRTQP